jgi:hypothetical protein
VDCNDGQLHALVNEKAGILKYIPFFQKNNILFRCANGSVVIFDIDENNTHMNGLQGTG